MRVRPSSPALLALLLLWSACLGQPMPPADAVARLDGDHLRYPRFEAYLEQNLGEAGTALPSEVLSALLDQFLDELLLVRRAAERGLVEAGSSGRRAAAALLTADAAAWQPTPEEVATYYAEHGADFSRPERVRLQQILVEERADAEKALAELRSGADFAAVAERLAEETGAVSGADQEEMARSELPPDFADTIFALAPGEVSDVVPATYGFHLFRVVERLPARQIPLAEAEPEIQELLGRQARERYLDDLLREARGRHEVEVFPRNLPFTYLGRYPHESLEGSAA